ncbi:xanthine dehydrogenase subunit D [Nocardia aurantia]|uniref:Putative xanthine dehydrogenase subunit D n=1 Tax=Nocardia aurantia TaxID=2585199 RepID=A0A7K0E0D7_9NOCA|nr:xanthine dehydrogenase subunit D [Nocardia aurantia]MQY31351.1 putative xanthine dehydrogenase subunit D [Nocardia aurantia]
MTGWSDNTSAVTGRLGDSPLRPDGAAKVTGAFPYASDLRADGMLWGATLRSPHPHARITRLDTAAARALPGVYAVLTRADVPGLNRHGLEHPDQPVLAEDIVRCEGEPIAIVAAADPALARRALSAIEIDYTPLEPLLDPWRAAFDPAAPRVWPAGNIVRHVPIRRGDPAAARARAEVVVRGDYEVGMQDQAFLGPEAGLAIPDGAGGVTLHVASQWIHLDRRQLCRILALPADRVRVALAGVGGAFGGREDLSVHAHACLLALRTGRPVKMVYDREESFHAHVHRHPARLRYEHGALRDGTLLYVRAQVVLDGGAYTSCSPEVAFNAAVFGAGPYDVPAVHLDAYAVYTHNPVCGAMRGFGAVQVAVAYEAQMDRLAARLGADPVTFRQRHALRRGSHSATGQLIDAPAPVAELLQRVRDLPLPSAPGPGELPGGALGSTRGEGVRRGVGYAVGFKNVAFGEGADDYSIARIRLHRNDLHAAPEATVYTAAAEVGQGLVTVLGQIVRAELGVGRVRLAPADTDLGEAGSTSASRQTYMTGGAVRAACDTLRESLFELARRHAPTARGELRLRDGAVVDATGRTLVSVAELLPGNGIEAEAEYHHRRTGPLDPVTGQGDVTVQFAFCAHRAVVDVDTELGIVKVVALDAAQDVGRALNPDAVTGQIQGGALQGMGLAVMEELIVENGKLRNPSFTDYLIPTALDAPSMRVEVLELADPHAPYGLRGVGEPPTVSATPAVAAAVRAATGRPVTRVPIRPDDVIEFETRCAGIEADAVPAPGRAVPQRVEQHDRG